MPMYEYRCRECDARFERLSAAGEADGAACPSCGSAPARRLLSVIGGLTGRARPPAPPCARGECGPSECARGACEAGF
ncbi:MAG: zinc ribbon domain-containing protein [Acidobacteria bacterium]|nr:zinc ribbon domain-containing protein [Acidobacteriota bacterium]